MYITSGEIAFAITAFTLSIGLLALFFILIVLRQYRLNAQRRLQTLNAVLEAQEGERSRIAQDMHDGLGQLLAASKLQADALRHAQPDDLKEQISTVKETLDHASDEVRNVIQDLVPRKLERDGLWQAIEDLSATVNASKNLQATVAIKGERKRFNTRVELNLYRIVQELVTNAVKHAEATEIAVTLDLSNERFLITVADNGKGFDTNNTHEGNGMKNIQSRTAWLNGTFQLTEITPNGTSVQLTFATKHLNEHE